VGGIFDRGSDLRLRSHPQLRTSCIEQGAPKVALLAQRFEKRLVFVPGALESASIAVLVYHLMRLPGAACLSL
jgi:hypothetical protein